VELEPLNTRPTANVTVRFSTGQENGVLLYNGEQQHLAVELFHGRLRVRNLFSTTLSVPDLTSCCQVSFDVGNYPVSTMYSFEQLSDSKLHTAEFLIERKNFTLRVDQGRARSIINEGDKDFLRLTSALYLGGVPSEVCF